MNAPTTGGKGRVNYGVARVCIARGSFRLPVVARNSHREFTVPCHAARARPRYRPAPGGLTLMDTKSVADKLVEYCRARSSSAVTMTLGSSAASGSPPNCFQRSTSQSRRLLFEPVALIPEIEKELVPLLHDSISVHRRSTFARPCETELQRVPTKCDQEGVVTSTAVRTCSSRRRCTDTPFPPLASGWHGA